MYKSQRHKETSQYFRRNQQINLQNTSEMQGGKTIFTENKTGDAHYFILFHTSCSSCTLHKNSAEYEQTKGDK